MKTTSNYFVCIDISIFMLLSLLFVSCNHNKNNTGFESVLNNAESCVINYPDSSIDILKPYMGLAGDIKSCSNTIGNISEEQRARYCLILSNAENNSSTLTSDTLVNIAAKYYFSHNDHTYYKALTYLNLGLYDINNMQYDKAVDNLYAALKVSNNLKKSDTYRNYKLLFLIYSYLATVYNNQYINNDDAISMYKSAYDYAAMFHDFSAMASELAGIARTYNHLQKYDSSFMYCFQALKLFNENNKTHKNYYYIQDYCDILLTLGVNYLCTNQIDSAFSVVKTAYDMLSSDDLKHHNNNLSYESVVSLLSELYFAKGEIDSARYYSTSLFASSHTPIRWQVYDRMYKIAKDNDHNYELALNYYEQAMNNKIQYDKKSNIVETQRIKNSYEYQKEKALAETAGKTHLWSTIAIFTIILIIIMIAYIILNNHIQREKLINEKLNEELLIMKQNVKILVKELENLTNQFDESSDIEDVKEKTKNEEMIYNELIKRNIVYLKAKSIEDESKNKIKNILTEDDWDKFVQCTNLIFNNFVDNLHNAYPNLLKWDIRVCCLLKNDVKRSTIAELLGLELKSLQRKEQRITRDRINKISADDKLTLDDIINQFQ